MILEWTEEAIADVEAQRVYIARSDPSAADRVALAILAGAEQLLVFPKLGRAVENESVRVKIVGRYNYKLLYEIDEPDGIVRILRVFHPRQDQP